MNKDEKTQADVSNQAYEAPRILEDVPLEAASLACVGAKSDDTVCGVPFIS